MIQQFREESDHVRHELAHPGHQAEKFRKWLRHPDVRLVLSLVGGTAVWGLYFSSLHALNSLACRFGWFGVPAESGGLKLVQIVVTIFALSLIAGAGSNVYKLWRTTRRSASDDASVPGHPIEPGSLEQTVAAYTPFAAFVLLLLNAIYFLIILVSLAPIATLTPCGG